MKIADAEREIRSIWITWEDEGMDKHADHFGLYLYGWLQENRPDLLSFRCSDDKYQRINGWVMKWQRHMGEF